jgi:hypothetical protein
LRYRLLPKPPTRKMPYELKSVPGKWATRTHKPLGLDLVISDQRFIDVLEVLSNIGVSILNHVIFA